MVNGDRGITATLLLARWNILAQVAAWILSMISGFLLAPPVGSSQAGGGLFHFSQFVLTVFVGLMAVPAIKYGKREYLWAWWATALLTLVGGVAMYFVYQHLTDEWTETYSSRSCVVGSVLTDEGAIYAAENPTASAAEMLADLPGGPSVIWTKESIDRRRMILAIVYMCCMPFFTASLIAVTQALFYSHPGRADGEGGEPDGSGSDGDGPRKD